MKNTTKTNEIYKFRPLKSYKPEEIIAAGGTTAFAEKMGKTGKQQMERLEKLANLPADYFLTEQEFQDALKILREEK